MLGCREFCSSLSARVSIVGGSCGMWLLLEESANTWSGVDQGEKASWAGQSSWLESATAGLGAPPG